MGERMVRSPAIPQVGVPVPFNRRLGADEPELTAHVGHQCRAIQNEAFEGRWTVPPAVTLVLEEEIRLHDPMVGAPERLRLWVPVVPVFGIGFFSNCLPIGLSCRGVARKRQEHIKPKSGMPSTVSTPTGKGNIR
jgi:hypothetical protein